MNTVTQVSRIGEIWSKGKQVRGLLLKHSYGEYLLITQSGIPPGVNSWPPEDQVKKFGGRRVLAHLHGTERVERFNTPEAVKHRVGLWRKKCLKDGYVKLADIMNNEVP